MQVVRVLAKSLVLTAMSLLASPSAWAANVTIDVDPQQRVTVSGAGDSLRNAIEEICERANVMLVSYEAEDHAFSATYTRIPLSDALARLLRSEVYLAGVRPGESRQGATVTWLRVSGSKGGVPGAILAASSERPKPNISLQPGIAEIELGVAPKIVETALASDDTGARANARRLILEALRDDEASLHRFADREVDIVVDELAAFPHAVELVNAMQSVTRNVEQRNHIQDIVRSLKLRQLDMQDAAGSS